MMLLLALLGCILIPVALATRRWLYVDAPSTVDVNGILTLYDSKTTTYGLLSYCSTTAVSESCSDLSFEKAATFPTSSSCDRKQGDIRDRLRAATAMLVLSFFSTLALLILSVLAFKTSFDSEGQEVQFSTTSILVSRERSAAVRVAMAALSFLLCLCSAAIYGATFGSWLNCGAHYCDAVVQQLRAAADAEVVPSYLRVRRDFQVNCGFGFSFAINIALCLLFAAVIAFIVADYLFAPRNAGRASQYAPTEGEPILPTRNPQDSNSRVTNTIDASKPRVVPALEASQKHEQEPRTSSRSAPSPDACDPASDHQVNGQLAHPQDVTVVAPTPVKIKHRVGDSAATDANTAGAPQVALPQRATGGTMPEGDDWEFDAEEDLYWSPSQLLYFDHRSGHFFDPSSRAWYDPLRERWYAL